MEDVEWSWAFSIFCLDLDQGPDCGLLGTYFQVITSCGHLLDSGGRANHLTAEPSLPDGANAAEMLQTPILHGENVKTCFAR